MTEGERAAVNVLVAAATDALIELRTIQAADKDLAATSAVARRLERALEQYQMRPAEAHPSLTRWNDTTRRFEPVQIDGIPHYRD